MIVSTPPLILEYMMPTFPCALPTPVTWHQDMATAMTNALNNFLMKLQFKWSGTVTGGTYTFPLGGNCGTILEQVSIDSSEVWAACVSGNVTVALFAIMAKKLTQQFNCMLGVQSDGAFMPLVFQAQPVFFAGTNFIAQAGFEAYAEMVQPSEAYQENPYIFYEIIDKFLAKALNKMKTVIAASGPATGGEFAGTAVLSPDVKTEDISTSKVE